MVFRTKSLRFTARGHVIRNSDGHGEAFGAINVGFSFSLK